MLLKVIRTLDYSSFPVSFAAFLSDKELFALALDNRIIRLWHANRTFWQILNSYNKLVNCITFSPNSKLLISALDDNAMLRLWNLNNKIAQVYASYSNPVAFSPDNTAQASRLANGDIELRGAVEKTLKKYKPRYQQMLDGWPEVTALAFSPNRSLLAYRYNNRMLKL
jgi:WD40 repeat protein